MAKWHPKSGKWGIFGETSGSKQARKASASIGRFLGDLENRRKDITSFYSDLKALEDDRAEGEMLSSLEDFLDKSYNIKSESEEVAAKTNLPTVINENVIMAERKIEKDRNKFLTDYQYQTELRNLNLGEQEQKELFQLDDIIRNLQLQRQDYS
tara:strand:+ start:1525 stop:1986 length:462 start_codon:yes stop_codon:yes gene_type:complete